MIGTCTGLHMELWEAIARTGDEALADGTLCLVLNIQ